METYWVCPPDSFAADEAAAMLANAEHSRGNSSPKGRTSPVGRRSKEEHLSETCSAAPAGRSPTSSSRPSRNHSPPASISPTRERIHQSTTLGSGSDDKSVKDAPAAGALNPHPVSSGAMGSLAALKRQALLLCGASDARNLPASSLSPGHPPSHTTPPSPIFSRRSLAGAPAIPAAMADQLPPQATATAALLEGTVGAVPVPSLPAPATASSSESVTMATRSGGEAAEDWC